MWRADPGNLRLKQACRTILAVLLSILITWNAAFLTRIFAGLVAGFCVQGIQGHTLRHRLLHVLLLSSAYMLVFTAGVLCNHHRVAASLLLAALAFIVFYLQKYTETVSFPPMMLWTCCYLATILPLPEAIEAARHLPALLIGCFCAILVALVIFPKNTREMFQENDDTLLSFARDSLHLCLPHVAFGMSASTFSERYFEQKYRMLALLELSQTMLDTRGAAELPPQAAQYLLCQYGLIKALSMLYESYEVIMAQQGKLPRQTAVALSRSLKKYRLLLSKLIKKQPFKPQTVKKALASFNQHILELEIDDHSLITAIMNIKLAMNVLSKTLIGSSQRHVSFS